MAGQAFFSAEPQHFRGARHSVERPRHDTPPRHCTHGAAHHAAPTPGSASMRRYTAPLGFTLAAIWVLAVFVMVSTH
ncbi:hypothetical protein GCM10009681_35280 [Luedemannella helvata]|uniref:Uncharacterized protein n=1 Tax=Luedemannella helvata TaxID=349315 RepID=A0ABP4WU47_9ACTN